MYYVVGGKVGLPDPGSLETNSASRSYEHNKGGETNGICV